MASWDGRGRLLASPPGDGSRARFEPTSGAASPPSFVVVVEVADGPDEDEVGVAAGGAGEVFLDDGRGGTGRAAKADGRGGRGLVDP